MTAPVYGRVNPTTHATYLTTDRTAAAAIASQGFTTDSGVMFYAATAQVSGMKDLVRSRLMTKRGDYLTTVSTGEVKSAADKYGYADAGPSFYAVKPGSSSATGSSCLVPVYRYVRGSKHVFTLSKTEYASYARTIDEGVAFYAAKTGSGPGNPPAEPPVDSTPFTIAVYPDTQQEVLDVIDKRYLERTSYLLANRSKLNLKFMVTVGDNVNWDTADHSQYRVIANGLQPLHAAGVPYALAIGNHDSQATGPGGAARDARRTRLLQRDTSTFNAYFSASVQGAIQGVYENGKVDNAWSAFDAGGAHWMVMVLELWPRADVVDWANAVIAEHPNYNVVISTHSYLDGDGSIFGPHSKRSCNYTRCEYGDSSGQYLWDHLISQHSNIKIVLSGHVGATFNRTDSGKNGAKVASFLTALHSNSTNPIRFLTIDPTKGSITTWVYGPHSARSYAGAGGTYSGFSWEKP